MNLKITFVNPNSDEAVDKYLPKILAEAIINKVVREMDQPEGTECTYKIKHSA